MLTPRLVRMLIEGLVPNLLRHNVDTTHPFSEVQALKRLQLCEVYGIIPLTNRCVGVKPRFTHVQIPLEAYASGPIKRNRRASDGSFVITIRRFPPRYGNAFFT